MSKELNALKEITYSDNIWEREDYAKIIENGLKVLNIIIEKDVDITLLRRCSTIVTYNKTAYRNLTEEEFNLIKRRTQK